VHYEALDVYEQHSLRILGVTQILNLAYAMTITTTSQAALQATIAHHQNVPNNPYLIPISVNLFLQQLIVPPINDAPTFVDPVGNSFEFFNKNFQLKVLKKIYSSPLSLSKKRKPSRCFA